MWILPKAGNGHTSHVLQRLRRLYGYKPSLICQQHWWNGVNWRGIRSSSLEFYGQNGVSEGSVLNGKCAIYLSVPLVQMAESLQLVVVHFRRSLSSLECVHALRSHGRMQTQPCFVQYEVSLIRMLMSMHHTHC